MKRPFWQRGVEQVPFRDSAARRPASSSVCSPGGTSCHLGAVSRYNELLSSDASLSLRVTSADRRCYYAVCTASKLDGGMPAVGQGR
jgi:hypothetical protein